MLELCWIASLDYKEKNNDKDESEGFIYELESDPNESSRIKRNNNYNNYSNYSDFCDEDEKSPLLLNKYSNLGTSKYDISNTNYAFTKRG